MPKCFCIKLFGIWCRWWDSNPHGIFKLSFCVNGLFISVLLFVLHKLFFAYFFTEKTEEK